MTASIFNEETESIRKQAYDSEDIEPYDKK